MISFCRIIPFYIGGDIKKISRKLNSRNMDVDAEKWMLNTWFVLNWLIGPVTILCWMLWKRLANGNDREVGTNLRVQQTNASDARIASDTAGPGGLVGPVQISTDVNAVESPRAGEVRQQCTHIQHIHCVAASWSDQGTHHCTGTSIKVMVIKHMEW